MRRGGGGEWEFDEDENWALDTFIKLTGGLESIHSFRPWFNRVLACVSGRERVGLSGVGAVNLIVSTGSQPLTWAFPIRVEFESVLILKC